MCVCVYCIRIYLYVINVINMIFIPSWSPHRIRTRKWLKHSLMLRERRPRKSISILKVVTLAETVWWYVLHKYIHIYIYIQCVYIYMWLCVYVCVCSCSIKFQTCDMNKLWNFINRKACGHPGFDMFDVQMLTSTGNRAYTDDAGLQLVVLQGLDYPVRTTLQVKANPIS